MKEEKIKLQTKIFRFIFIFTLIVYLTLYFGNEFGYFEYQKQEQAHLTQEQIKKFEQDIKDGKEIDIDNYIVEENKDYSNNFSNVGLKLSNKIKEIFSEGVKFIFNSIGDMVNE